LKKDLSWTGLPKFVDDTVTDYSRPTPSIDESKCNTSNKFSIFEHGESSCSIMSKPMIKFVKVADCPRVIKTNKTETARKSPVKYAEMYMNTSKSPKVRGTQRETCPKNNFSHKNVIPRAVLFKTGKTPISRPNMNVAQPKMTSFTKIAHSNVKRPFQRRSTVRTQPRVPRVSTVDLKFPTAKSTFTADLGIKGKVVKASACWIWRPKQNTIEQGPNYNGVSVTFKKYQYIDTQGRLKSDSGCSRHMIGNISYLSEYEPYDGGYVSFGQGIGKITGKGIIKTGKLKFENDYLVKELNKAFMVFNKRTKKVEENLHVDFLENKLIKKGAGPNWLFDIDTLTKSMNYVPVVVAGTSSTSISGTKDVASQAMKKDVSSLRYIALLNWFHEAHIETKNSNGYNVDDPESSGISNPTATSKVPPAEQVEPAASLTVETKIPTVSSPVLTVCLDISPKSLSDPRIIPKGVFSHEETPSLGNALTLSNRFEDTFGEEADLSNMETSIPVSPTSTFRIHKDHPKSQIIGPVDTPVQTRHKSKEMVEQSFIATIHHKTNPELLQFYLFLCFLSQEEPKKIFDALKDPSWMDVKSAFLYGTIDEEVYVMQPPRFQDPEFPDKVYKVEKAMYGLHQAPRAWYGTLSKYLLDNGFQKEFETLMHEKFQMSAMGELTIFLGLQILQKKDDIFLSHDKYVGDILKKFGYSDVRHQVTPKECHLHVVKRIFRYLKGHPKLGIWYPKDSPFDLVAYSDSDYGGAT
nr:hypothetical protein [Tanacetum cinerariifolium]